MNAIDHWTKQLEAWQKDMHKCNCCGRQVKWSELKLLGVQKIGDGGPDLEMRLCICGTTLGRDAKESK